MVLLAALCYGLQPLFAKYAYVGGADPVGLLLARYSIAAGVLLLILRRRGIPLPSRHLAIQNFLLGAGYGVSALGYYVASRYVSVGLAVILVFTFPTFVTAGSIALLGERTNSLKLVSLTLALGGVLMATGLTISGSPTGVLWALFSAICYSIAVLYGTHRILHEHPLASAVIVLLGCGTVFVLVALFRGASLPSSALGWWSTVGLALFSTLIPLTAFLAGASRIGPSSAATVSTLEPVVAIAVALMGEQLTSAMICGGGMVVLAALLLARRGVVDQGLSDAQTETASNR
ncbi:DMT family transporter [Pseudomonas aeruginosa]|uniref:DMT family transporter n=1 Tax=Pseudomonas aeruginosa TaxID=287 RepID=UPI0021AEB37D|nr:DMT family transporter [Pseudomonas aeruginosa]